MTRFMAVTSTPGGTIAVPLAAKTLNGAIDECKRGGRRFCAEQTFDICLYDREFDGPGEMVAEMIDIDASWLEAWGDPEEEAEKYRP